MYTFEEFKSFREVCCGREKADLLIKNAKIVNVITQEVHSGNVAVKKDRIVGFFDCEAVEVIDAEGAYVVPNLIDCHMHIESTMVTPDKLNDILLPRGVGTLMCDPHEIANVLGIQGIEFMLKHSENLDLEIYVNLPSCVPCLPSEHSGAVLKADQLRPFYEQPRVYTLGEVMNYFAVRDDDDMLRKLYDAYLNAPLTDGHGSILDERGMDLYAALNIRNDHECVNIEGMQERLRRGIYTFIREGSVTKNLRSLIGGINEKNFRFACFCTDDCHLDDLLDGKGVHHAVKLAIQEGLDPIIAITMCTLNAATCYQLKGKGAIAPGYQADFFLCDSLRELEASLVVAHGKVVARDGKIVKSRSFTSKSKLENSICFAPFNVEDLRLPLRNKRIHVMGVMGGNVLTTDYIDEVEVDNDGYFVPSVTKDQALLCVVERHKATGNIGKCVVTGFHMQGGAIATSVAHDSHNIICLGMNEFDMDIAIHHLMKIGGGYCIVREGKVVSEVALEVGGLMSLRNPLDIVEELHHIHKEVELICKDIDYNPFLMLSFISLPVIPEIKLSDVGLIDVRTSKVIPLEAE